ncbi:MAG: 16S rRNA (cytosine(967)-C(5))-methyltransferase RsmB [Candidatus Acidiferrales bacterium]
MTASPRKQASRPASRPSARALAYSILLSVETEAAYASELLRSRLDASIDAREAALATELVMGTLRWQRLLDFFVERYTGRKTTAFDREVLVVLRLGIYQLRYLTRMPARAAVSESVELVKRARKKSAAPLVNVALRRAAAEREQPAAQFVPTENGATEALAISHSHPTWLVERWLHKFGEKQTIALLEANNQTPERGCVFLSSERREDAIRSLNEAGSSFEPGRLLRDAIVVRRGNVAESRAFRDGWIGMQDEASQMIPLLAGAKQGDSVLDLCAAPGGKTMALASLVGEQGHVVAADFHEARLRAMRERLAMAGAANVSLVALDGTTRLPFTSPFDRILVDAPCSGTGTLARNPEIRWRLSAEDLADLHRRQVALVQSALEHLSSTGDLLYSTCSLEPQENESVVSEVLAGNPGFRREALKISQGILADGVSAGGLVDKDGAFRTFPPMHHTDGFFAALIARE